MFKERRLTSRRAEFAGFVLIGVLGLAVNEAGVAILIGMARLPIVGRRVSLPNQLCLQFRGPARGSVHGREMTLPGRALLASLVYARLILVLVPFLLAAPVLLGWVAVREEADLFVKEDARRVVGAMTALLVILPFASRLRLASPLSPRASIWALAFVASRSRPRRRPGVRRLRPLARRAHGQLRGRDPAPRPALGDRPPAGGTSLPDSSRSSSAFRPAATAAGLSAGERGPLVALASTGGVPGQSGAGGGLSVLAAYAVGRRLWPERQDLALVSALFVAISSQELAAAMTPYAMTAHMAFNLARLRLHLRGGKAGDAGGFGYRIFATGLHQLVFHLMFAAPFVLQLWLDRRWRVAAAYTLAYAAICLFWLSFACAALVYGRLGHAATGVGGLGTQSWP